MFDTHVTIVGNVLHEPEWRRTVNTGALVTTFKVASTARRLDRETGRWVDGNSLRVRVTCWRSLASNVQNSVTRGDPVIVAGRLFTRDWIDEHGAKRTQYELEAHAVGHDLSRGRAVFERVKSAASTSAVEDTQTEQRVGGEPTERVSAEAAPSRFDDTPFEVAFDRVPAADPTTPAEPRSPGPPWSSGRPASVEDPAALSPDGEPGEPASEPDPLDDAALVAEPEPGPAEPSAGPEEPPAGTGELAGPGAGSGSAPATGPRRRGARRGRVPA